MKKWKEFNESLTNIDLSVDDLSGDQREFLTAGRYDREPEFGIEFISDESEYIEYGDKLHTITFKYNNSIYELIIVWESGPGTWSWDGDNNEGVMPELTKIEDTQSSPLVDSKEVFDYIKKMITTWEGQVDGISDYNLAKLDGYKSILDRFKIEY